MCTVKKSFLILIVLALIGFGLSSLSLYQYVSLRLGAEHTSSFCSISEHVDCTRVHLSDWSSIFGIPLASYGLGFYLLILIISLLGLTNKVLIQAESRDFITVSSFFSVLSSIALFYISEVEIGALCPVCLAMYATNFLLFLFSYRMAKEEIFLVRIKNAFWGALHLLEIWIPKKLKMGFFSRILTVLALSFSLVLVRAGEPFATALYFAMQEDADILTEDKKARIVAQYVGEWEKEPVIQIDVKRGSVLSSDFTKGTQGAPIQIIEFSDYACPHCQDLGKTLTQYAKDYPGAFEAVHKDFPLDSTCNKFAAGMHPGSCLAAEFARCAGEQGNFWQVAEVFYSSGVPEGETPEKIKDQLMEEASSLGLDRDAISECLTSGRQLEKIKLDAALGDALKLQGTPGVWINGKFLRTPHRDIIKAIIEKSISQSK